MAWEFECDRGSPVAAGAVVVMVATVVDLPAVQAATVSVAVSAAAIRNVEVRSLAWEDLPVVQR